MCDRCFELFSNDKVGEECPVFRCFGKIVDIDSEIGYYISEINKQFKKYHIPLKTNFSCIGHTPGDFYPYIGFAVMVVNDDEFSIILKLLIDFFTPLVNELNKKIRSVSNIIVNNFYEVSSSILKVSPSSDDSEDWKTYRIFINKFSFDYVDNDFTDLEFKKFNVIIKIQSFFKEFLLDIINLANKVPEEIRIRQDEEGN